MKIEQVAANLINGNLKDAKAGADSYSHVRLFNLFRELGWTTKRSHAAANYLKGVGTFQAYADAK